MAEDAPPNFDRVALIYRYAEYASLGPMLQRARTHFLPRLLESRRATVIGDGDGRFLARWLAVNQTMQALAVDSSESMLELLRSNCVAASTSALERLNTRHISAFDVTPAPGSDTVVSHFFLDCFTQQQLEVLVRSYAQNLPAGALWLLSDFALPHSAWLRPVAAIYIRCLYFAFRILTGLRVTHLPDPQKALTNAGFTLIARQEWLKGFVYTELWSLE
jgi:cyclopropane fatty-acyl-phospholipid synthase-like methyltransferase